MLSIKEAVKELEANDRFQTWKDECPKSYLCHCMQMLNDDGAWYIGYYNKEDDKITTFAISKLALSKESTEEVFKEPGKTVEELDIDKVTVEYNDAVETAKAVSKSNYPTDLPSKNIVIVQTISGKQVYNITFVTLSMSTVNIKIDAATKEIVSHKKTSLMEFDASKELEKQSQQEKK